MSIDVARFFDAYTYMPRLRETPHDPAHPLQRAGVPRTGPIPTHRNAFAVIPVVPTSVLAHPYRGPIAPQKPTRSLVFRLRLSPAEKATLDERAKAAGLKLAEYVRRESGVGHYGRAALRQAPIGTAGIREAESRPSPSGLVNQEGPAPDRRRRVNVAAMRMSRSNAERVVSQEEAQERARAALK